MVCLHMSRCCDASRFLHWTSYIIHVAGVSLATSCHATEILLPRDTKIVSRGILLCRATKKFVTRQKKLSHDTVPIHITHAMWHKILVARRKCLPRNRFLSRDISFVPRDKNTCRLLQLPVQFTLKFSTDKSYCIWNIVAQRATTILLIKHKIASL